MAKKASKSTSKKAVKPVARTTVRRSPVPKDPKAKKTVVRNSALPKPRGKSVAKAADPTGNPALSSGEVTYEMIATRAYFIAQSGFGGSEFDNWLRAEWELRNGRV